MKGKETRTCQACGCEISGAMKFCPVCKITLTGTRPINGGVRSCFPVRVKTK